MNIQKDPREKSKTFLSRIIQNDLEGDTSTAEEILSERFKNIPKDLKEDLKYTFLVNIIKRKVSGEGDLEVGESNIEIYPVLVVSSSGEPDTGAFLVGKGDCTEFELIGFDYIGYPGYFHEVDSDPFYYSTY